MKKFLTLLIPGVLLGAVLAGCQTADPASRSNRTEYRDLTVNIKGDMNSVEFTVGDGLYASADGGGDTQSNTPVQTTDVKTELAAALNGGSAGTGNSKPAGGFTDFAWSALQKIFNGQKITAEEAKAISDCADGNCELP